MTELNNGVLVAVCCITYNQTDYISDCIESIFLQKTNFDFKVYVGDDNSTDGTWEKLLKYQMKLGSKLCLIRNINKTAYLPGKLNFINTLSECKAKYIALCEGDDYWTDPYKLQKQVDFLERNDNYALVFHDVKILKDGVLVKDYLTRQVEETTTILDLADGNYIHTPSVAFRYREDLIPNWFYDCPIGDYALHMLSSQYGKIKKLSDTMAVYRVHSNSYYSSKSELDNAARMIHQLELMLNQFSSDVQVRLKKNLLNLLNILIASDLSDELKSQYIHKKAVYDENYAFSLWSKNKNSELELLSLKRAIKLILKRLIFLKNI